ncbi:D-ribose pyranase [Oceanobacillus aidingensis]|uniref:D-ribose pyranase n=1 Tax=Oceanobacillus aidingensis TaxID=645964 RepID=A0ABV9JSF3_9BACI
MKKIGILNHELSREIAKSGHLDKFVIGDAGLPVPEGVKLIDLALIEGQPSFISTLEAVLRELHVEEAVIDKEMMEVSPNKRKELLDVVSNQFPIKSIPHAELQNLVHDAKVVIRTGEFTPYCNIVLTAGVLF